MLANSNIASRYFIERGTWDDTIGTFINSDGDPSQFAVSFRWPCYPHSMPDVQYTRVTVDTSRSMVRGRP